MTDETANLVLEILRGMRGDIGAFRSEMEKRLGALETRLGAVEERLDTVDTQLEGLRYVVVASVGSLVTDLKDQEARIARLEGARP